MGHDCLDDGFPVVSLDSVARSFEREQLGRLAIAFGVTTVAGRQALFRTRTVDLLLALERRGGKRVQAREAAGTKITQPPDSAEDE